MHIRVERCDDGEEEIVIRCRHPDGEAELIKEVAEYALKSRRREILLFSNNTEHFVDRDDILFFDTSEGKVYAHTKKQILRCEKKLFMLEDILPSYFVRISKSSIVNVKLISSLSRELTGNGRITFKDTEEITYFSRAYYKILRDRIEEVRLK